MNICVFGAASDNIAREYIDAAAQFGSLLAQRGHGLVFGGGAHGIMGAVARAALGGGATVLGITPEFFNTEGVIEKSCTEIVVTNDIHDRLSVMQERSDAFVALPGGIGTMDELLEVFMLRQIRKLDKPVAMLNVDGYYQPLIDMLNKAADERFLKKKSLALLRVCESPEQVITYFESCVR